MARFNDERRRYVSSRHLWGMPAPVWTMGLWAVVEFINLSLALLFAPDKTTSDALALAACCLYMVALMVVLLVMKARTPIWFLHTQVLAILFLSCLLVYTSTTNLDMVSSSFVLFGVTMYSAYWFKRRTALVYMGIGAASYLIAIILAGELELMFVPWFTISTVCIAIGATFSTVVLHLYTQAVTDNLTGLLNRSGLQMMIDLQTVTDKTSFPRALLLIDLDGFKLLNDSKGHLAGDQLLKSLGATWSEVKRANDVIVRTGGDEFLFILSAMNLEDAEMFVKRLKNVSHCEWSYGITLWERNEDFDHAMRRVDALLYKNKASKREFKEFAETH